MSAFTFNLLGVLLECPLVEEGKRTRNNQLFCHAHENIISFTKKGPSWPNDLSKVPRFNTDTLTAPEPGMGAPYYSIMIPKINVSHTKCITCCLSSTQGLNPTHCNSSSKASSSKTCVSVISPRRGGGTALPFWR